MIALAREHLARPGVTVTESKKLVDAFSGQEREVDVVAEGEIDGEDLVVSVEVVDRRRVITLPWVDEMVGKHLYLPTNQLVLVSWSGFSRPALAKISALPRVSAITPKPVLEEDGTPRMSKALCMDQITMTATILKVRVRRQDGSMSDFMQVPKDVVLYDEDDQGIALVGDLADRNVKSENIGRQLGMDAHNRDDRSELKSFSVRDDEIGERANVFLRNDSADPPDVHKLMGFECIGKFTWRQTKLQFAVVDINGRAHGVAQEPMLGRDSVWVATPTDENPDEVKISWRAMDLAETDMRPRTDN